MFIAICVIDCSVFSWFVVTPLFLSHHGKEKEENQIPAYIFGGFYTDYCCYVGIVPIHNNNNNNNHISHHPHPATTMDLGNVSVVWLKISLLFVFCFAAEITAACEPYPVPIRIGNVSLSNGKSARGIDLGIGEPEQAFAFMPQWFVFLDSL